MADRAGETTWHRGYFAMRGADGKEWTVSGDFVYGKWGVSKRNGAAEDRKFWNLTHLPSGFCVLYTTNKDDAKLAAAICDGIADFTIIKSIEAAAPYMPAVKRAFEQTGFRHHGGARFERWEIGNDN